jgi:hypothetical protein
VPRALQTEVAEAISSTKAAIRKGAGAAIRDAITGKLIAKGWSKEVSVSQGSKMTITSTKSNIGLCLQTGNMARMYADLLKLQKLYMDNAIKAAVLIVPSQPVAKQMGDNITHAARLERELEIFKKAIHVPILLFSIESL